MDEFQEYSELEKRLRRELGRVDAPPGFADRLMQRIEANDGWGEKASPLRNAAGLRRRGWLSGVVAAAIAAGIFAGVRMHEVRRAEMAEQQFDSAMRITGEALEKTREQLQRAGVQLDKNRGE